MSVTVLLTAQNLRDMLQRAVNDYGGQTAWAKDNGIPPSVVSDVLHAKRDPGPAVLRALGLVKVTRYVQDRRKTNGGPGLHDPAEANDAA